MLKRDTLLHNSKIGMWIIELKDKPCLHVDDNMLEIIGLKERMSPEDTYEYWYSRIDEAYLACVNKAVVDIISGKTSEIEYCWNHPEYGKRFVRCGGYVNKNYSSITLEGYHQDIDELIKRKNSLDDKHELLDQLSYVNFSSYYMDIYDEMAVIDPSTHMMKWIFRVKNKYTDIKTEEKFFEVVEKSIYKNDQLKVKEAFNKVSENIGSKEYLELRIRHIDNHYSWVRMMLTCIDYNDEKRVLSGIIDIDAFKKNEESSKDVDIILDVITKENLYIYDVDFNKNVVRIIKNNKDDIKVIDFDTFEATIKKYSSNFTDSQKLEKFMDFDRLKEVMENNISQHLDVQLLNENFVVDWYRLSYSTSANLKNRVLISVKKIERDDILSSVIYQYMVNNFEMIFYVDLKDNNYRRFLIDNKAGIKIKEFNSYSEGIDYVIDKYVIDKDKAKLKDKLNIDHIWDIFDSDNFHYTSVGVMDDNKEFHEKGLYFYVFDEEKQIFLVLVNDITKAYYQKIEQENMLRDLRKNATIDELTGLSNRYHCEVSMIEYIANEGHDQLSALLLLDLDNFKTLNDTLGHSKGDEALKDVSEILKEFFRSTDIVSRYGGDEFVVLMKNIRDVGVVDILMPRLLDKLKLTYSKNDQEVQIGASIGVAYAPYDGRNVKELLEKADQALYEIKKKGKGNYKVYNF